MACFGSILYVSAASMLHPALWVRQSALLQPGRLQGGGSLLRSDDVKRWQVVRDILGQCSGRLKQKMGAWDPQFGSAGAIDGVWDLQFGSTGTIDGE